MSANVYSIGIIFNLTAAQSNQLHKRRAAGTLLIYLHINGHSDIAFAGFKRNALQKQRKRVCCITLEFKLAYLVLFIVEFIGLKVNFGELLTFVAERLYTEINMLKNNDEGVRFFVIEIEF